MKLKYKHVVTGAVIDTPSKIISKSWKLVDEEKVENKAEEVVEEEIDLSEMTNKELEAFAKEHHIELTAEDKKNKETRIAAIAKNFE